MFIGAGDWDKPQLNLAIEAGLKTIVTNQNPESLCLKIADISILADGRDIYKILSFIFENNLQDKILFIYSGTELFTTVSTISKVLNIPWHSILGSYICEKKHLMRKYFSKNNIKTPLGFSAKSFNEFENKKNNLNNNFSNWIFKPSDSLSSKGVSIADSDRDLYDCFSHALSNSLSRIVICEEFIPGTLHDINGILNQGKFYPLGINDKKAAPPPYAVVVEGTAPTILMPQKQDQLYGIFEKACVSVGLTDGPVKGDSILSENGDFYIMEVAPRLHGPLGSIYLLPNAININPFKELIHLNLKKSIKTHNPNKKYGKSIAVQAVDNLQLIDNNGIIKILEKPGLHDRASWTSNNDVPYYIVKKCTN